MKLCWHIHCYYSGTTLIHFNLINMINRHIKHNLLILFAIFFLMAISTSAMAEVSASYLYRLSNFNGLIPYHWANIIADKEKNEIYVVDTKERDITVFNENGMEVYRFGDDGKLGTIGHLTVYRNGDILVLSRKASKYSITLCDFRGNPKSEIELKNIPSDFSGFLPDRIAYRKGRIYLTDTFSMMVVVTDPNGHFENGYDIASLLDIEEKKRDETEMADFSVDREGNMLFTIPSFFGAFRLSPDGNLTMFGEKGSAPGKFGVVAGIAADDKGYIYVSDKLRCVVLIFDKELRFQAEFGNRGYRPGNLIVPNDLTVDSKGRVYVAQAGKRGVSVFKITYN